MPSWSRVGTILASLLGAAIWLAACGSDDVGVEAGPVATGGDATTSPVVDATNPRSDEAPIIVDVPGDEVRWTPVHEMDAGAARQIDVLLEEHQFRMLFPTSVPADDPTNTSGWLRSKERIPAREVVEIAIAIDSVDFAASISTTRPSGAPSCTERYEAPEGSSDGTWEPITVRGTEGCSQSSGFEFLAWEEGDQHYQISFTGLSTEDVVAWLATWTLRP